MLKFARCSDSPKVREEKPKAGGTISRWPAKVNPQITQILINLRNLWMELPLAKPRTFPLVSATQVITMKIFFVLKIRPDLA
jgi:hypothetical protein